MIGQTHLRTQVDKLLDAHNYPRFSIFVGDKGSGKKTFIRESLSSIGTIVDCELNADSVREIIQKVHQTASPTVYFFADADTMSIASKNALLKIIEEPPRGAYFVMTLVNAENMLPTVRSRAVIFQMDNYTPDELIRYYHSKYTGKTDLDLVRRYCQTPGDIDSLCSYDVAEFKNFLDLVINNIEKVSGANSFKMGKRLALDTSKSEDDLPFGNPDDGKYSLSLFWKAFRAECIENIDTVYHPLKYVHGVTITSKYMYELRIAGINKQMCFDNWLLDIRQDWMRYAED